MFMRLEIEYKLIPSITNLEYDPDLDDVRSILSDVSSILFNSGCARFSMGGFGDDEWPVDVETDLPVLLEQLPDVCTAIRMRKSSFNIDFYEQGLERTIYFDSVDNDGYSVRCVSQTTWVPEPSLEFIERKEMLVMLNNVRGAFLDVISSAFPYLQSHPWIIEWSEQTLLRN